MLETLELNYWAILVAGVVSYVIGMIWYMALSKPWMKAAGFEGKTREEMKEMGGVGSYIGSLLIGIVMAYAMARLVQYAGAESWTDALLMGLLAWVGFVAVSTAKAFLWENKPWKLWVINNGDHLIGMIAMALIVTLWT